MPSLAEAGQAKRHLVFDAASSYATERKGYISQWTAQMDAYDNARASYLADDVSRRTALDFNARVYLRSWSDRQKDYLTFEDE